MSDHAQPEGGSSIGSDLDDVDEFSKKVLGSLMHTIKSSSGMPNAGDDFDLYSSFSEFRKFNFIQGSRLINMINSFLHHQGLKRLPSLDEDHQQSAVDIDDKSDCVIEANDTMLEQIGTLLDEATNTSKKQDAAGQAPVVIKNPSAPLALKPIVSSWNRTNRYGKQRTFKLFHAQNIARPQLKFKDKIDNSNVPFVPKITLKPNSIKPLPQALIDLHKEGTDSNIPLAIANLVRQGRQYGQEDQDIYEHPYSAELAALKFSDSQLKRVSPQKYDDFPADPCELIATKDELIEVIEHLKTCSEFAVDLEHHSYRSFQGITCLMQISSRTRDFIIDTLNLRSEIHMLNVVFTDPKIVKVFHGAHSDIQWLQRDFGVYVVNMFDTYLASKELSFPRFSLDYLLQTYCNVHADKKYQLADWRVRPLPSEMRKYAQEDTHYLLYIYDVMKNELLDLGGEGKTPGTGTTRLQNVLCNSRNMCLIKYEKPLIKPTSYLELYERQHKKQLNDNQLELLRLLFLWRDTMARQEDESTGYVLPKHMLFQIAEIMPREAQGVLACCNPVPPLVRQHVHTLHQLVLEARAKAFVDKVTAESSSKKRSQVPVPAKSDTETYDDILFCPHDMSHEQRNNEVDAMKVAIPNISGITQSSLFGNNQGNHVFYQSEQKHPRAAQSRKWDPFAKFFPTDAKTAEAKSILTNGKRLKFKDSFSLKNILSPDFVWKLRDLEAEKGKKNQKLQQHVKSEKKEEEVIVLKKLPRQSFTSKRPLEGSQQEVSSRDWRKKFHKKDKGQQQNMYSNFKPHEYHKSHYERFQKK